MLAPVRYEDLTENVRADLLRSAGSHWVAVEVAGQIHAFQRTILTSWHPATE